MRFFNSILLRRSLIVFCLLLGLSLKAAAQNQGDGSIYSRYGLGELQTFSSSQIEAMGGGGTALRSFNYLNFRNPASWSDQVFTRVAAGAQFQTLTATDAIDNTSHLTAGALNAVQFSFPLLKQKLGVAFGLKPYSRVNYRVQLNRQLPAELGGTDSTNYRINYDGNGGLQQVVAGLGYRFDNHLSIGANANVIFGRFEDTRRVEFNNTGYLDANLTNATRLSGITGTVGALYTNAGVLREADELTIGAAVTGPAYLFGEQVRTLLTEEELRAPGQNLDRDTLGSPADGSITLPLRTRLGLAYRPDERWLIVADGAYEPWSQFEQDFSDNRRLQPPESGGTQAYTDRLRLSTGFEFLPAGEDRSVASYLQRTAYRLGAYYEQSYVSPLPTLSTPQPQDVRTLAATGGLSLPTLLAGTRLDLNLEVGTQGTTGPRLVRDVFYRVSLNVNIGEEWFVPRRLR